LPVLEEMGSSGSDTVALVYLLGFGLQHDGENSLVPVEAELARVFPKRSFTLGCRGG
jgi:uncharacterized caspase-like protein